MLDPWRLLLLSELEALGTVRAVGAAQHLSPSTVSQQLATLEREVGVRLLQRRGRRVELTAAGRRMVRHARIIADQMAAARAEVTGTDGAAAGPVRVGAFTSALTTIVLQAGRDLQARVPALQLVVTELDPAAALTALQRGHHDVVVTVTGPDGPAPDPAEVDLRPLGSDRIVLVAPAGAVGAPRLSDCAAAAFSSEAPGSWSHDLLLRCCRAAGFEPRIVGAFASYGPLLAHVEAGLSLTVLPELSVDPRYRVVTSALRPPMHRSVVALTRSGAAGRPAVAAVLDALGAAAQVVGDRLTPAG